MNNSTTKHQHYVYREYLRSWANSKDQIWCVIDGKILCQTNLMNVAQCNYFYRTENPISDFEKMLLYKMSEMIGSKLMHEYQKSMIYQYDQVLKTNQDINLYCKDKDVESYVQKIINQSEEKIQSYIESLGVKYLKKLKNKDLNFLQNDEEKAIFYYFVAEQHTRTKKFVMI